jgi:hypothetical protein
MTCLAFLLGACQPSVSSIPTDTSGGPPPGDGSVTDAMIGDALAGDQACLEQATARCMKLMTCSPTDLQHRFGDLATCQTRSQIACNSGVNAPDTAASAVNVLACANAIPAMTCAAFLSGVQPPAACLPPSGPGSGTCAFDAQCADSFCGVGAFALCGLCEATPVVGTPCTVSGCGPNLECFGGVCETPGGAGAQCGKGHAPCLDGFTCVGSNQNNSTCKISGVAVGTACDPTQQQKADCNGDLDLTCNTNTKKCVTMPFVAAGQPCGTINNVFTDCIASTCVIPQNQTKGTCVAPAADGAACSTAAAGPDCQTPARCIPTTPTGTTGTCQLPGSKSC